MPNWLPADTIVSRFREVALKCKSLVELEYALEKAQKKNSKLWENSRDSKDISTSVNADRIGGITADNLHDIYTRRWRQLKLEEERAVPLPVRGG